jgi:hypothetical protein
MEPTTILMYVSEILSASWLLRLLQFALIPRLEVLRLESEMGDSGEWGFFSSLNFFIDSGS